MDDWPTGIVERPDPLVRRLLAPNPSPFTYSGTQTFIVGRGEVAIIDPGPDIAEHVEAIIRAVAGERVTTIVCTHSHVDHSPASRALRQATGAPVVGCAALSLDLEGPGADESFDAHYRPDRVLSDGETLRGEGWSLEAVATPGHTSNHICLALREADILFSGDHVMGWSTSIVVPPDGDMGDYMASLDKLLARDERVYYPAHGPEIAEPHTRVRDLIAHRRRREAEILRQLEAGQGRIPQMVRNIYRDVDPSLHPAAERSVLAHLLDLKARGLAREEAETWSLAA